MRSIMVLLVCCLLISPSTSISAEGPISAQDALEMLEGIESGETTVSDPNPPEWARWNPTIEKYIKDITLAMFKIRLQAAILNGLKEEPALNTFELKWVVAIEDLLVDVNGEYNVSKVFFQVAAKHNKTGSKAYGTHFYNEATLSLSKGKFKHDKVSRDLKTLLKRFKVRTRHRRQKNQWEVQDKLY